MVRNSRSSIPGSAEFDRIEWMVVGDHPYELVLDRHLRWLQANDGRHTIEVRDLDATVTRPVSGDGRVKAPIPGLITRLMVDEGQQRGDRTASGRAGSDENGE